jgi:nitrogen fixation/metabolism regulation signal transduction histidine kinase
MSQTSDKSIVTLINTFTVDPGNQQRLVDLLIRATDGFVSRASGFISSTLHRSAEVFQPFYTTKSSGVGMGLSICRSIIDAHGGRLWADANEPRGAVFQFTLPSPERSS